MGKSNDFTVNDPIHGMICFKADANGNNLIKDLISTPEFQRLRRIKQLGCVDFVYPGATHTRFAHSIGVAWLVHKAVSHLLSDKKTFKDLRDKGHIKNYKNSDQVILAVTCAGLLHDVGHSPFSHSLDKFMLEDNDLEDVSEHLGHEARSVLILKDTRFKIREQIVNACKKGILPKHHEMVLEDISYLIKDSKYDQESINVAKSELVIFKGLTHGQLDCDRFDYLQRDTYYCGTPIRIDYDFIIRSMELSFIKEIDSYKITLREKAIPSIEHYLISRLIHYQQVAFHRAAMFSESLLTRLIKFIINPEHNIESEYKDNKFGKYLAKDISEFINFDDSSIIEKIKDLQNSTREEVSFLAKCFLERIIPKVIKDNVSKDKLQDERNDFHRTSSQYISKSSNPMFNDYLLFFSEMPEKIIYESEKDALTEYSNLINQSTEADPLNEENKKKTEELSRLLGIIRECILIKNSDEPEGHYFDLVKKSQLAENGYSIKHNLFKCEIKNKQRSGK